MEKSQPEAAAPAPAAPETPVAPAAPVTPVAAPKKKKTGLIVTIIIVVLALIGGSVAAFFLLRKNPTDVVADAFINTTKTITEKSGNVSFEASMKIDASSIFSVEAILNGKASKEGDVEANINVDLMGKDVSADVISKGGKLYAKIQNLSEVASMLSMFGAELPTGSTSVIKALEGEWFYTDAGSADITSMVNIPNVEEIEDLDMDKDKFNETFSVEPYSGDVVSAKKGDLYKLTLKDESLAQQGIDAIYLEIKDGEIVRVFTTADVQGISMTIDITFEFPESVNIEAPAGAKDMMTLMAGGSSSKYSSLLDIEDEEKYDDIYKLYDDLYDDLDEDDLDEDDYEALLKMLEDY